MKLTYEELEAKLGATEAKLARTEDLLKQALDRILKLEEQLNKNSKNSSKPPSSDQKPDSPPGEKKKRRSRAGRNRQPYPPERINHQIECTRDYCPHCQATNLQQLPDTPFSWQQAELPDIEAIVTQYDCLKYKCNSCHRRSIGSFPDGVPFSSFGPKLMAFVSCLTGRFHLSKREAMLLLRDLYGIDLSEGSVINIEENVTNALEEVYEKIHRYVIEGCLPRYFDETSWRDSGKKHYVWIGATHLAACYRIDRRRSQEALTRFIGTYTRAPAITDRYNAYNILDGPRQYCLAHLVRDFHAYSERQGDDGEIGSRLENELRKICKTHNKWGKKEISKSQWASLLSHSKRRLREDLLDGIVFGSDGLSGLCDRIDKDFENLWHFKTIEGMDPTNNMAERDLRKLVLWRRKSYGTRSLRGQRFVERITSVIETLKKNSRAPLKFLEGAVSAFYNKQPAPSIATALGI